MNIKSRSAPFHMTDLAKKKYWGSPLIKGRQEFIKDLRASVKFLEIYRTGPHKSAERASVMPPWQCLEGHSPPSPLDESASHPQ